MDFYLLSNESHMLIRKNVNNVKPISTHVLVYSDTLSFYDIVFCFLIEDYAFLSKALNKTWLVKI